MATLNEDYRSQFPEDRELPHIWPLSAGMALEARDPEMTGQEKLSEEQCNELEQSSRIRAFEDRLWKYLTQGERRHDQLWKKKSGCWISRPAQKNCCKNRPKFRRLWMRCKKSVNVHPEICERK